MCRIIISLLTKSELKILITEWMRKLETKTTDILMSNLSWEAGKHTGKLRHRPLLHILQGVRCLGLFESQRQRHLTFLTVCVWFTCSRSHRTLEGLWWKRKFSVVHPRIWIFSWNVAQHEEEQRTWVSFSMFQCTPSPQKIENRNSFCRIGVQMLFVYWRRRWMKSHEFPVNLHGVEIWNLLNNFYEQWRIWENCGDTDWWMVLAAQIQGDARTWACDEPPLPLEIPFQKVSTQERPFLWKAVEP